MVWWQTPGPLGYPAFHMEEDKAMAEEESPLSPIHVARLADDTSPREMVGPLMVDQIIHQAIQHCWMSLPRDERSPDRVEQEILRVVHRALQNMHEDAAAFGFSKEDTPDREKRLARIRAQHPKAYDKWIEEDDSLLTQKFGEGASIADLARSFQRQPSAIRSRLAKLGLM